MYLAGTQYVPRYFSGEVLKMNIGMPLICLLTPVIWALRCQQGNSVGVQLVQRMVMQGILFFSIKSRE